MKDFTVFKPYYTHRGVRYYYTVYEGSPCLFSLNPDVAGDKSFRYLYMHAFMGMKNNSYLEHRFAGPVYPIICGNRCAVTLSKFARPVAFIEKEKVSFSTRKAVEFAREAFLALHQLHSIDLAHCNINTTSVCVTDNFTPVLFQLGEMRFSKSRVRFEVDETDCEFEKESVKRLASADHRQGDVYSMAKVIRHMALLSCDRHPKAPLLKEELIQMLEAALTPNH